MAKTVIQKTVAEKSVLEQILELQKQLKPEDRQTLILKTREQEEEERKIQLEPWLDEREEKWERIEELTRLIGDEFPPKNKRIRVDHAIRDWIKSNGNKGATLKQIQVHFEENPVTLSDGSAVTAEKIEKVLIKSIGAARTPFSLDGEVYKLKKV